MSRYYLACVLTTLFLIGCSESEDTPVKEDNSSTSRLITDATEANTNSTSNISKKTPATRGQPEFQKLYGLIVYGQASLKQVMSALQTQDTGEMVNIIHALYSMRWHRGVHHLLNDMWALNNKNRPDLPWDIIEKIPVRIAIASTINRAKIFDTDEYKSFIRKHKYAEHEFHRAQVIIALGLNRDPVDIDYLVEMANEDNVYLSQSAITSLAIMHHERARDALMALANKYKETARGKLIIDVLAKAYDRHITKKPPSES